MEIALGVLKISIWDFYDMTLRELGCAVKGNDEVVVRAERSALTRTRLLSYFVAKSGFMKWDNLNRPEDLFSIHGEEEEMRERAEQIPLSTVEPADNNW